MKKIFFTMMTAAAVFALASCDKNGGSETPEDQNFIEEEGSFTYYGETYRTVTLSDGSVWMAEPLRYVPEGLVPSDDPTNADAHIWYPYTISSTDGSAAAATDEATIRANGYLYDLQAVFGTEITADNCGSFEGAQGICPDGWHIPTRADYLALCGYSNKTAAEGAVAETDENALFYDAEYNGGKISSFNDAGWNFVLSGWMQRANFGAEGKYANTPVISESNCSIASFYGKPALSYYMSSTSYQPVLSDEGELTNIQFFSLMTTFTSSRYPEGRVTVAYASSVAGQQVRCVKDAR